MMDGTQDERDAWVRHRSKPTSDTHQALFFRYVPWARSVARDVYRRVRVPQMDWSDYAQNATIGLLEAMSRYDETRGIDFMAYAKPRVRGAVFNGVRSFLADISRRENPRHRLLERLDSFDGGEGDDPLSQIISAVSGLGLGLLLDSHAALGVYSHDADASALAEQSQVEKMIGSTLELLPQQERLVLTLHYLQHMPFVEIARMMALTKGRISQVHKAGIERCRRLLNEPVQRVNA